MEVLRVQITEKVDDPHHVFFNDGPTSFEESVGEAIRPGCLISRHLINGAFDLLLRDGVINDRQVNLLNIQVVPIEILGTSMTSTNNTLKMGVNDVLLEFVVCDPTTFPFQLVYVVFSLFCVDAEMEELGICVALFDIGDACTLFFWTFQGQQG